MHACMHTCIHAYMHTCIHTYIHAYMHTYLHAYILTCLHTYILTYLHTYIHSYILTHLHTVQYSTVQSSPVQSSTVQYIHTYIPHTHTHTYIYIYDIHTYAHVLMHILALKKTASPLARPADCGKTLLKAKQWKMTCVCRAVLWGQGSSIFFCPFQPCHVCRLRGICVVKFCFLFMTAACSYRGLWLLNPVWDNNWHWKRMELLQEAWKRPRLT